MKSKNKIHGIEKQCKDYNRRNTCSNNHIIDLRNVTSTCITTNGRHIPRVDEVKSGMLLLNNINRSFEINSKTRNMTEMHLINFYNSTIKVNKKIYSNNESILLEPMSYEHTIFRIIKNSTKISNLNTLTVTSRRVSINAIPILICVELILYLSRKKN